MERRKFLIGMGTAAAGSAAVVGTGAMNSVRAERSLEVAVVGDSSAHLSLNGDTDSPFVSETNPIAFDFGSDAGGGEGVNNDATTEVRPAFTITNELSNSMYVEIDNPAADSDITEGGADVQFIATEDASGFVGGGGNRAILFDRDETVVKTGSPSETNPASITQTVGGNIQRGLQGSKRGGSPEGDSPHYLQLYPGASVDVIVRVVANNADDFTFDGTAEIRAFDDEGPTYISDGPSEFGTPSE